MNIKAFKITGETRHSNIAQKIIIEAKFPIQKRTIFLSILNREHQTVLIKPLFLEFPEHVFLLEFTKTTISWYDTFRFLAIKNEYLLKLDVPNLIGDANICLGKNNPYLSNSSLDYLFQNITLQKAKDVITSYINPFWHSSFNWAADNEDEVIMLKTRLAEFENSFNISKQNKIKEYRDTKYTLQHLDSNWLSIDWQEIML